MAMLCDKPVYSLTKEDINEINEILSEKIKAGADDVSCELEREEGFLRAFYDEETKEVSVDFEWADRDGDASYFDLKTWVL